MVFDNLHCPSRSNTVGTAYNLIFHHCFKGVFFPEIILITTNGLAKKPVQRTFDQKLIGDSPVTVKIERKLLVQCST